MARKELGVDKMGIQKTMRFGDYMADAGGQFALNGISGLVSAITYFYTDKVGVSALMAANVLLAAKVVDAFTDLIMGKIMDNGKSPKGKCRPWFLRMAIPALVAIVALFTVPKGLSGFALAAYLFLTNIFATAIVSTAIAIPYGAIMVMRTKSIDERSTMGIFRAAFGYVIGMIIAIALVPITNALGPNGVADQASYIKFAVVVGVLSAVFLFILYKRSKETAAQEEKPDDGLPFMDAIKKLFKNKYWVIVLIANLFVQIIYAVSGASGTYYAKWILGNEKFGVRKTLLIGFAIGVVGAVVRVFFPASLIVTLTAGLLPSFATIPMMCLGGTMNSMAMDYNDYVYGNKIIGMSASAISFGSKIAGGLGGSIIGWILAAVNYDANAATATTAVRYGIYSFSIYLPLVILVVLFIIVSRFDIEGKYADMLAEIKARNEAAKAEETVEAEAEAK